MHALSPYIPLINDHLIHFFYLTAFMRPLPSEPRITPSGYLVSSWRWWKGQVYRINIDLQKDVQCYQHVQVNIYNGHENEGREEAWGAGAGKWAGGTFQIWRGRIMGSDSRCRSTCAEHGHRARTQGVRVQGARTAIEGEAGAGAAVIGRAVGKTY